MIKVLLAYYIFPEEIVKTIPTFWIESIQQNGLDANYPRTEITTLGFELTDPRYQICYL